MKKSQRKGQVKTTHFINSQNTLLNVGESETPNPTPPLTQKAKDGRKRRFSEKPSTREKGYE
jgi:hypothetical protein